MSIHCLWNERKENCLLNENQRAARTTCFGEVKSHPLFVKNNPTPFLSSGVTFSFFWKTQAEQSRTTPFAFGGQVISNGFKVCSSGGKGSVELYTRDNSMTWKATFSPPGKGAAGPEGGSGRREGARRCTVGPLACGRVSPVPSGGCLGELAGKGEMASFAEMSARRLRGGVLRADAWVPPDRGMTGSLHHVT